MSVLFLATRLVIPTQSTTSMDLWGDGERTIHQQGDPQSDRVRVADAEHSASVPADVPSERREALAIGEHDQEVDDYQRLYDGIP